MKSKKHKKNDRHNSDHDDSQHRPLKLVLKVGPSSSSNNITITRKKKKSKKHKLKHRSHHSKSPSSSQSSLSSLSIKSHTFPNDANQSLPSKSPPTSRRVSNCREPENESQFKKFLASLLQSLQKRDTYDFFGSPVTDKIAPDYKSIISHPMDFGTIKKKLDQGLYQTLHSFRSDVKLICDNAMVYNTPNTIYYKEAQKLWLYAESKIYNKKVLPELAKPYLDLSPDQLVFDLEEGSPMNVDSAMASAENSQDTVCSMRSQKNSDKEMDDSSETKPSNDGELTAEQILASVKLASDRLKKPIRSHLSYLHQESDGTTTLSVIGGQDSTVQKDRTVTLGNLVGQIPNGISCLPTYKEPEENRVNLVDSVSTEPFSSFLPSLDSTNATLSEEETQLLRETYGDEKGFDYIKSIVSFAGDNNYALDQVDELLETITSGEHSKTMLKMKDFKMNTNEEEEKEQDQDQDQEQNTDENKNENENEYNDERKTEKEPYKLVVSDISSDEDKPEDKPADEPENEQQDKPKDEQQDKPEEKSEDESEDNIAQLILDEFLREDLQNSSPSMQQNDEMKANDFPFDENPVQQDLQNHEASREPTALDLEAIINELKILQNF